MVRSVRWRQAFVEIVDQIPWVEWPSDLRNDFFKPTRAPNNNIRFRLWWFMARNGIDVGTIKYYFSRWEHEFDADVPRQFLWLEKAITQTVYLERYAVWDVQEHRYMKGRGKHYRVAWPTSSDNRVQSFASANPPRPAPTTNVRVLTADEQYRIAVNRQEAVRRRTAKQERDAHKRSQYQLTKRSRLVRPKLKKVARRDVWAGIDHFRHSNYARGINYGG
jgi:hypothetical protein